MTACAKRIADACGAAIEAQAMSQGDTTEGTVLFASCTAPSSCCFGGLGAAEQVYSYTTPGFAGTLSLSLESEAHLGIYVRSDCVNPASQIACRAPDVGGMDEKLDIAIADAAIPLFIFVDASI